MIYGANYASKCLINNHRVNAAGLPMQLICTKLRHAHAADQYLMKKTLLYYADLATLGLPRTQQKQKNKGGSKTVGTIKSPTR